jgi:hypothetical protein
MRAQNDLGIREDLNTSGIKKEKLYMEKEVAAIYVGASMLWLVGTAKGNNYFMLQVLLMLLLHMEGSNKKLSVCYKSDKRSMKASTVIN